MRSAGIDIGSRFIKFVMLEGGDIVASRRLDTGYHPLDVCESLLAEFKPHHVVVTGYGRQLFEQHDAVSVVTEIKAVGVGVYNVNPECRTIIDIGGQDTKVIALSKTGRVTSFEMNDRCAAGTGRFLEVMSRNLDFSLEAFGELEGETDIVINSLCTVFAESEVISLIARGVSRHNIGLAVQRLIAEKVGSMAKRQTLEDQVIFTGGCAFNQCLRHMIEKNLERSLYVSPQSPFLAAYGAALLAREK